MAGCTKRQACLLVLGVCIFNALGFAHITKGKYFIKAVFLACAISLSNTAHAELVSVR